MTLDGTTVTRNVSTNVSATAVLGASCAIVGCATIESALAMVVDTASCSSNATGGCDCAISQASDVSESTAYRVEGTQVITSSATYDFCVSGDSMQHREVGADPAELGILDLSRR